jgi:NhaA family Na+:H+ antiporter
VNSKIGIRNSFVYIFLGISLWYFLYRSGIHATLSGVILGLLTPNIARRNSGITDEEDNEVTIIEWLETKLHPWSSFAIVPIFAFANTGVEISSAALKNAATSPIAWGIFFGLVAGKPLGILFSLLMAKKLGAGSFPEGSSGSGVLATGSAAGIGFTVAIFIAHLAFRDNSVQELAIIAVILGSAVSGLFSLSLFKIFDSKIVKK